MVPSSQITRGGIASRPCEEEDRVKSDNSDSESDSEDYSTPLTTPATSPIKPRPNRDLSLSMQRLNLDGTASPPNVDSSADNSVSPLLAQRRPSTLLQYCDRYASPRQRRLMGFGLESPDRFISSRVHTPTKESLLLRKSPKKSPSSSAYYDKDSEPANPFGPRPNRSLRMAERFATVRRPLPSARDNDRNASAVPGSLVPPRRAVSAGAVWTVGGTVVTEGIASITNGRGGRVTSGTSAPHYAADFLQRQTPSEEEIMHGRRLAAAMEIDQRGRMLTFSQPRAQTHSENRVGAAMWKNGAWEQVLDSNPKKARRKAREIPEIPFRVLDAPALRDDYYCSLLSYSHTMQCLAVGLGPHVYLWSEARGTVPSHIPDSLTTPYGAHVTSVSFSSTEGESAIVAIGRADGRITLWSPKDQDPRFDSEQPAPVSCVCFRPNAVNRSSLRDPAATVKTEELLVGDEVGSVYLYSIEWPTHDQRYLFNWHGSMTLIAKISCHAQQVCGISWSPEGEYFATGGNDNQMFLFQTKKLLRSSRRAQASQASPINVRNGDLSSSSTITGQGQVLVIEAGHEKHVFTLNAAVKAIAFAPWQPTLLAAGGGSNDRCIHFFHASSGATLATIDCYAQVTSLAWSEKRKEIVATFGFAQPEHPYRIAVFTWPDCRRVVGIPWYGEERALYAVMYPGGPSSALPRGCRVPNEKQRKRDAEGRAWCGKRTREEGCLVVATSDASIKFHEIWPEHGDAGRRVTVGGLLTGSQILEDGVSPELERSATIR